ncbi:MAG: hypothetical protein ABJG47_11195 [Ekhidna sp.]
MKSEVEKIILPLKELDFKLTKEWDGGMHKVFEWSNQDHFLRLVYDRGYYDCEVGTLTNQTNSYDLVQLLRFLRKDRAYYRKEIEAVNLMNTLTITGYVELFKLNFQALNDELLSNNNLNVEYARFVNN